jgi:cell wall-associated NlpC family hydrolase
LRWPAIAALCLGLAACGQAAAGTTSDPSAAHTGPSAAGGSTGATGTTSTGHTGSSTTGGTATHGAGSSGPTGSTGSSAGGRSDALAGASSGTRSEVADPDEAESYPAPANVHHASADSPSRASEAARAAGSLSDAEIRQDLHEAEAAEKRAHSEQHKVTLTPVAGGQSIGGDGKIPIPAGVPEVIQKVIAGANEIADFPYVFGGGHGSFIDHAYDCSGSVSYALAAGGLLSSPEVSGELEHWGAPGPGHYITVYANAGHTYMYIDGILFDTAGRSGVYASRWLVGGTDNSGYVVRHWPGL